MSSVNTTETTEAPANPSSILQKLGLAHALPAGDLLLIFLGLLVTLAAKTRAVIAQSADVLLPLMQAALPDLLFFSVLFGAVIASRLIPARPIVFRATLLIGAITLIWSVLNAAWLLTTGVQLQPGVLLVLLQTSSDMWALATAFMFRRPLHLTLVILVAAAVAIWFLLQLLRPAAPQSGRLPILRAVATCAACALLFGVGLHLSHRPGRIAYSGQIIGFSSHWYALTNFIGEFRYGDVDGEGRVLPRSGERVLLGEPVERLPNVVIVLLESLPFAETSMADPEEDLTPVLARLAAEGTEFRRAYVSVPQTTKAFWMTFTGMYPEIFPGYAESIIADEPYEGLPTLLGRFGYRSAFFQMSPGTFESLPAFFANLDFDHAWFPESLRDPGAMVSMLSGDDHRMLEPMFEWVDQQEGPFLLTTITSVAHDPFTLPEWYMSADQQPTDRRERFLAALRYQDAWIADFLERLYERSEPENTIVIVAGDHGESFRPEARRGRWGVFEELVRVPLVIHWPGRVPAGLVDKNLASLMDIAPTVLALLGLDVSEASFDGENLFGSREEDRRIYLSAWHRNSPAGFVERRRKLVHWPTTDVMFEFDLERDPEERHPRTLSHEERLPHLADIDEWQRSTRFDIPARRFREGLFYDHWSVFSSGRTGRSFFVEAGEDGIGGR